MKFKLKSAIIVPVTIFLCLAFSVFTGSFAQLNSGNLTQFKEKDGLPGARVNALLIDKLGYSWVGTINGLARYDGYEFKRYYFNPNDTGSIHGLIVWSLHEDRRGKIWVATSPSFLNVFDPATRNFRQYDFSQLVNHSVTVEVNIRTMCEDNN